MNTRKLGPHEVSERVLRRALDLGITHFDTATLAELDALLPPGSVAGERYPPATQAENDTEDFR